MYRSSRSSGRRPTQSRTSTQSKTSNARKHEWVSTVHDLTVHKATPEELKRRHDLHKSQNRVAAQWEMKRGMGHRLKKGSSSQSRPAQLNPAQLNIIREVFSDNYQLHDVLARSDEVLAVVNDLFGDAPPRQTGLPNVTVAPDSGPDADLPVRLRPEPSTSLYLLSQSVMDPQALNEFEDVGGRERNEREPDPPSNRSSRVDLSRFGRLLQEEAQGLEAQREPPHSLCPEISATDKLAARRRVSSENNKQSCGEPQRRDALTENRSSLSLLQSMLCDVEAELDSLESPEPLATKEESSSSLTGFSVSLLRTVTRLARCLRQSREDLQREVQDRKTLEEEVMEQRRLIDALTAETLTLREDSLALQGQLQHCVWDSEQRQRVGRFADSTAPYCVESEAEPHYAEREAREQPLPSPSPSPSPARRDEPSPGPAVLLSPPRQRSSLHPQSHSHSTEQGMSQQRPAVPSPERRSSEPTQILPPAVILQQISELTQQNALIRSQLQQFCTQPAGPQDPEPQRASDTAPQFEEKASPAGSCMEQRLLELNRQSTEARSRLLELIEEQAQASTRSVSPSVSPILPSMRASADGERRSSDASVSGSKQNLSPVGSCCGCRSASGSSVVGENQSLSLQNQVDRLKDEGWFALSKHMQ